MPVNSRFHRLLSPNGHIWPISPETPGKLGVFWSTDKTGWSVRVGLIFFRTESACPLTLSIFDVSSRFHVFVFIYLCIKNTYYLFNRHAFFIKHFDVFRSSSSSKIYVYEFGLFYLRWQIWCSINLILKPIFNFFKII